MIVWLVGWECFYTVLLRGVVRVVVRVGKGKCGRERGRVGYNNMMISQLIR